MIRYFDTEAAYLAAVQDAESQVSLIGESNACKFDGRNVIVGIDSATTGSIAYLDDKKAIHFVATSTFNKTTFPASYEIFGVVAIGADHPDFRGEIVVMHYKDTQLAMLNRYCLKLSGYTLDGAEHTGVLSIRDNSDGWTTNQDYTIAYKADNIVDLVSQLNAYFKANEPFIAQDWVAIETKGEIFLYFYFTSWTQAVYTKAKSGFSVVAANAPQWKSTTRMFRMNGQRNGEGTITNMPQALAIFREDNSSTSYNPNTDVTTAKLAYPICLPGYLGTSKYQSDHCAYLRGIYGEGEEGWLKFMQSFLPVLPSEYGIFDDSTYGTEKQNTYYLASLKCVGQDGQEKDVCPIAAAVAKLGFDHELLKPGEWVISKISRLFSIVGQLRYPTTPDRNADKINAALAAIDAPAASNKAHYWSCSRANDSTCWNAYGNNGYANNLTVFIPYRTYPLVILPRQHNDNV